MPVVKSQMNNSLMRPIWGKCHYQQIPQMIIFTIKYLKDQGIIRAIRENIIITEFQRFFNIYCPSSTYLSKMPILAKWINSSTLNKIR